jgi:glycosyltransferase involved in cell wall biosynthesis
MNIIFLINSPFPYYAGGIETWLYNVSKRLCSEHDITIISHAYQPYPLMFDDIPKQFKFIKFKTMNDYKYLRVFVHSYINVLNLFIGSWSMARSLREAIKGNTKYYIIALDTMFNVGASYRIRKSNKNVVLIASSRGPHAEVLTKSFPLCKEIFLSYERKMLKTADAIWANGFDTMAALKNKGFNSVLMRNGVDFNSINDAPTSGLEAPLCTTNIKISSVGTLSDIKGVNELIDACAILNNRGIKNIELFFVGKGEPEKYKDRAIKFNIGEKVHFLGHKSNAGAYMKKCDIIACLSGGGGMSMSAIEAMASGIPIIAWDSPVYRQFNVNNPTMHLVKERDSEKLADGIAEMISNYDYYKLMAQNAREESKSYDWSNIVKELLHNLEMIKK